MALDYYYSDDLQLISDLVPAPLPRFSGVNPVRWLSIAESYFVSHAIDDDERFPYVIELFDDEAFWWFNSWHRSSEFVTWMTFTAAMLNRFQIGTPDDHTTASITATSSVSTPIDEICNLDLDVNLGTASFSIAESPVRHLDSAVKISDLGDGDNLDLGFAMAPTATIPTLLFGSVESGFPSSDAVSPPGTTCFTTNLCIPRLHFLDDDPKPPDPFPTLTSAPIPSDLMGSKVHNETTTTFGSSREVSKSVVLNLFIDIPPPRPLFLVAETHVPHHGFGNFDMLFASVRLQTDVAFHGTDFDFDTGQVFVTSSYFPSDVQLFKSIRSSSFGFKTYSLSSITHVTNPFDELPKRPWLGSTRIIFFPATQLGATHVVLEFQVGDNHIGWKGGTTTISSYMAVDALKQPLDTNTSLTPTTCALKAAQFASAFQVPEIGFVYGPNSVAHSYFRDGLTVNACHTYCANTPSPAVRPPTTFMSPNLQGQNHFPTEISISSMLFPQPHIYTMSTNYASPPYYFLRKLHVKRNPWWVNKDRSTKALIMDNIVHSFKMMLLASSEFASLKTSIERPFSSDIIKVGPNVRRPNLYQLCNGFPVSMDTLAYFMVQQSDGPQLAWRCCSKKVASYVILAVSSAGCTAGACVLPIPFYKHIATLVVIKHLVLPASTFSVFNNRSHAGHMLALSEFMIILFGISHIAMLDLFSQSNDEVVADGYAQVPLAHGVILISTIITHFAGLPTYTWYHGDGSSTNCVLVAHLQRSCASIFQLGIVPIITRFLFLSSANRTTFLITTLQLLSCSLHGISFRVKYVFSMLNQVLHNLVALPGINYPFTSPFLQSVNYPWKPPWCYFCYQIGTVTWKLLVQSFMAATPVTQSEDTIGPTSNLSYVLLGTLALYSSVERVPEQGEPMWVAHLFRVTSECGLFWSYLFLGIAAYVKSYITEVVAYDANILSVNQFRVYHLEDKVVLKGGSNVMNTFGPTQIDPTMQPSSVLVKGPHV
ncbi:putative phosphopyruvate hydratase [Helianthus debilis subsp. tardiflorus]